MIHIPGKYVPAYFIIGTLLCSICAYLQYWGLSR